MAKFHTKKIVTNMPVFGHVRDISLAEESVKKLKLIEIETHPAFPHVLHVGCFESIKPSYIYSSGSVSVSDG